MIAMESRLWRIACAAILLLCLYCVEAAIYGKERKIEFGKRGSLVGGWSSVDPTDGNVVKLAKFAVEEHNRKLSGNQRLYYSRLVEAKQQVVQGVMYLLTVEATTRNKPSRYEAKVWVKEWENFKELMEFRPVSET